MALSLKEMISAIHKKNPASMNRRFTQAQAEAEYAKLYGSAGKPTKTGKAGKEGKASQNQTTQTQTQTTTQTPTVSNPDPVPEETPEEAFNRREAEFQRMTNAGLGFGNQLIDTLGIGGEFIPRVQEGPSQSYYDDLERLRQLSANAGNLSTLDLENLNIARNALEGLNAPENEALRSAAARQVDQQFGLQRNQLMRYQGGMGSAMQRAAQLQNLGSSRVDAQRNLSRDLLIENIQQKKDARLAFNNLANTVGARQDSRVQNLAGLLQSGGQFADSMKLSGQQYNSSSKAQEVASRTGALLGGVGATSSFMGGAKAEEFQNKALEEALAAKAAEQEFIRQLTESTLKSQENIMNSLAGKI